MKNTIKKTLSIVIAILMIVSTVPMAFAAESDVVILYTNDVHCTVDNYAVLAAYKAELIANGHTVITVDAGDAIQNDDFCSMTAGETVVDIMNAVGYDYAVPGNHEFDYGVDVFLDLAGTKANYNYISSNFYYLTSVQPVFEPYYIEDVGDYQIAFVGISTPETANASPEYFKNESGNFIYGFPVYPDGMTNEILYETIQESVDDAINDGADIVVAVGHTGITETTDGWKTSDIIANTSGIDYFIDGHSHETVEEELYQNINEEDVVRTSTGSYFANFGVMTIHGDGSVDFELIDPDTVNVDEMSADAKNAYNTVKQKVDDFNDNIDDFGHDFVDGICGTCGEVCTHIDTDYNEICDDCGVETPIKSVELNIGDTVYIPEEHAKVMVKFIPEESGDYVVVSDNGGNDDEIDPYVVICDSNGDEIEEDDDHDGSYNFCCDFKATAGETYYIELYAYESDVEYDYIIKRYVEISHQPTIDEPYVELNWDFDADYQWYSVEENSAEITDENAEGRYADDIGPATYDEEYGWSSAPYDEYEANYFQIELEAGQTVEMIPDMDVGCLGIWSYDGNSEDFIDVLSGESVFFTANIDDTYFVYTMDNSDVHIRAYLTFYEYTPINGETDATLKNPVVGTKYACKVTLEDGSALTSDILENVYAITHQPTADEPYVELNDDKDATYQWYIVDGAKTEITDENAEICTSINDSEYDAENGWTGAYTGRLEGLYDCYNYFSLPLKAGDIITIEFTEEFYGTVDFHSGISGYENYEIEGEDTCEIIVEYDGVYTISAYKLPENDIVNIKAYVENYEYTPVDGATEALYVATEDGLYACEVTFANGTTEMSDIYEGPHAHSYNTVVTDPTCTEDGYTTYTCGCGDTYVDDETDATGHADNDNDGYCENCDELICDHNCHKGGIAGFFWKITRFFNKLFGTNKYCECGAAHY
ncbi:MAG: hypothetical protein IKC45_05970 [Clostridia bacterium]|nr:hypothetical protein [Clostridia bacterium]